MQLETNKPDSSQINMSKLAKLCNASMESEHTNVAFINFLSTKESQKVNMERRHQRLLHWLQSRQLGHWLVQNGGEQWRDKWRWKVWVSHHQSASLYTVRSLGAGIQRQRHWSSFRTGDSAHTGRRTTKSAQIIKSFCPCLILFFNLMQVHLCYDCTHPPPTRSPFPGHRRPLVPLVLRMTWRCTTGPTSQPASIRPSMEALCCAMLPSPATWHSRTPGVTYPFSSPTDVTLSLV